MTKGRGFGPIYSTCLKRISAITLGLLVLLLLACSKSDSHMGTGDGASESSRLEVITSSNDPREYRAVKLENNLEVLLVSDPEIDRSAAALSVGVGLLYDPMGYQGLAHYLEHVLFLGSEAYPESDDFSAFIARSGGLGNASTWLDITNYNFQVANEAYTGALDRFSNFFKTPLFDPESIEKEKSAVNAEWSLRRGMDFFAMFRVGRSLLGDHPANRFLIGNRESLSDKPGSTLLDSTIAFYEEYYSANLMKAAMVSQLPLDDMEKLARKYFTGIPDKEIEEPVITTPIDFTKVGNKLIRYIPQEERRLLRLEFIIDSNLDQFRVKSNEYLMYILNSKMPNTPAHRLKELGWADDFNVAGSANYLGNYGVFNIDIELSVEGMEHREEIVDMVLGYIELLSREGVDDRYVAELKASLDNSFRFLEKTNDFNYVSQLARAMQDYPLQNVIDAPFRFDEFDGDAIANVLSQFTPERLRVWYVSKDELTNQELHFYEGKYSVEPLMLSSREKQLALAEKHALALPALNTLFPEDFEVAHADPEPRQIVDSAAAEFWLQGSEFYRDQPRGVAQIYLNTTDRGQSAEASVMLSLWSDLYTLSQRAYFAASSDAGISASISPGYGVKLTFSGFTDKQPELIRQSLVALRLELTETELVRAVDRYIRGVKNKERKFPFSQLIQNLHLITHTGEYADDTLISAAESVTVSKLKTFIDKQLESAFVRGYMFGNYSEQFAQDIAVLVDEILPNRTTQGYVKPKVYDLKPGRVLVFQKDVPVDDLGMLYLFAAPDKSVESQARAAVLAEFLRNRVFDTLRTEEQLAYAASASVIELGNHPALAFTIQTPVKNPADMFTRFEAFKIEFVDELAQLPIERFEQLKMGTLAKLMEQPQNLIEEVEPYIEDWGRERYDFDSRIRLIAAVESVSLKDIQQFYAASVIADDASRILIQLRGQTFSNQPFAVVEEAEIIDNVEDFHQSMSIQP